MRQSLVRIARNTLAWGVAWLVLGGPSAQAGFTVSLDSTTASGANTVFHYSASTSDSDQIGSGNFFRIYDFGGLVPGSVVATTDWAATVNKSDLFIPPSLVLVHGDDPAIENLTFTYKGSSPVTGKTTFTGFSATTTLGDGKIFKDFIGQSGLLSGGVVNSIGDVSVPNPVLGPPGLVPEPTSLISATIGAVVLGLAFTRRARQAA